LPTTTPHAMELEPCAHCGAPDAPNFCSGCRAVRYCGAACQRADWREHKPRCEHAIQRYLGLHDHTGDVGVPDLFLQAAAESPAASAVPAFMRKLPLGKRAKFVCALICALDVDRVTQALRPDTGVRTTMRASIGTDDATLFHWAAKHLSQSGKLLPALHERALAMWEAVVDAAPLSQLDGTADFFIADATKEGDTFVASAPTGVTPLSYVCGYCDRTMASQATAALLRRGVDANIRDPGGTFPLMQASVYQSAVVLRQLLDAGARASARVSNSGETMLHLLARSECPAAAAKVRLLAGAGADMEAVDSTGLTPLHAAVAVKYGSLRAFDALIAAGASTGPLFQAKYLSSFGFALNALHKAVLDGNILAVRHLTTLPRGIFSTLDTPVTTTAASPAVPALPGYLGATALHLASNPLMGSQRMADLLLRASSHLHKRDALGSTPLLRALTTQAPPGIVEALVGAGAIAHDADLVEAVAQAAASCLSREQGGAMGDVTLPGGLSISMVTLAKHGRANLRLLCTECVRRRVPLQPTVLADIPPGALEAPLLAALRQLAGSVNTRAPAPTGATSSK
jgi:ankyrin repeat protein